MTTVRYRAATSTGAIRAGLIDGTSLAEAVDRLRRLGLVPIEAEEVASAKPRPRARPIPADRLARTFSELAVLLDAGMTLDRALGVLIHDLDRGAERAAFERLLEEVREGRTLSHALAAAEPVFPPIASAMAAAGEANGRPAQALARLAETLERSHALRAALVSASIYPAMLLVIAAGVIGLMLFWVIPQFETLFGDSGPQLPLITRLVLGASQLARRDGAGALLLLVAATALTWRLMARASVRLWFDRAVLGFPRLGGLVAMAESARLMRVLASLSEGGVALPDALAIARRSLANHHLAQAVERVGQGLREGEGLTEPLAATGLFPPLAVSYLRTGEQTAQLPLMLTRLADTLDREVRTRLDRMVGLLTPLITVGMGAVVATVIASIMSAILGFDDLALAK